MSPVHYFQLWCKCNANKSTELEHHFIEVPSNQNLHFSNVTILHLGSQAQTFAKKRKPERLLS